MEQYIIPAVLVVIAFVFWVRMRNLGNEGGKKMSFAEVKQRLDAGEGINLVDVRTKGEYAERHIPKSILIPLDVIEKEAAKKLPDKDSEVFVYCASGTRSAMASRILMKLGYTRVYNLGGLNGWPYDTVSGSK